MPMFDLKDAAGVLLEVNACRKAFPDHYIKVNAFDSTQGWESMRLSFIVNRPTNEPGFRVVRQETRRTQRPLHRREPRGRQRRGRPAMNGAPAQTGSARR